VVSDTPVPAAAQVSAAGTGTEVRGEEQFALELEPVDCGPLAPAGLLPGVVDDEVVGVVPWSVAGCTAVLASCELE
jgi:hypothetical protein